MISGDLIGLGFAVLGAIIFLSVLFLSNHFKQSKGINEYKKVREKFLPKDEVVEPEEEEPEELETYDSGIPWMRIVSRLIGACVLGVVFNSVSQSIMEVMSEEGGSAMFEPMMQILDFFPVILVIGVVGITIAEMV